MKRFGFRLAMLLAIVVATLANAGADSWQRGAQKAIVTSITMDGSGGVNLALRDVGEMKVADGTFRMGREAEVVFGGGRIRSATLRGSLIPSQLFSQARRGAFSIEDFTIEDDGILMKVEKGEIPLPDGQYELQIRAGRDHGEERRATSFTVRQGKVTEVMIDSIY